MFQDNVGFNISPHDNDRRFSTIGENGTFLTDQRAIEALIPNFQSGQKKLQITREQARKIENDLGLRENSLDDGFKIRRVENVRDLHARSPVNYDGNSNFKGAGQHLPGGHPELVVDKVITNGDKNVSRTIEVEVKK